MRSNSFNFIRILFLCLLAAQVASAQEQVAALPDAVTGERYSAQLPLSNAVGAVDSKTISGKWPNGLSLEGGWVRGTPAAPTPTPAQLLIEVNDQLGQRVQRLVSIRVLRPQSAKPELEQRPLPPCIVGRPYDAVFRVEGGTPPYTWRLTGNDKLPEGISFEAGHITGQVDTALEDAREMSIVVNVEDRFGLVDSELFKFRVQPDPAHRLRLLPIGDPQQPAQLPPAMVGQPYQFSLTATGGATQREYKIVDGQIPSGIRLETNQLIGTPISTKEGTFAIAVVSGPQTATTTLQLRVLPAPGVPLRAEIAAPVSIEFGNSVRIDLHAIGGRPPFVWTFDAPPATKGWLSLEGNTLRGAPPLDPTLTGKHELMVSVADSAGDSAKAQFVLEISIPKLHSLQTFTLQAAIATEGYSVFLPAVAHSLPLKFFATHLPPGLTLDAQGRLHGTIPEPGTYELLVGAQDPLGQQTPMLAMSLEVRPKPIRTSPATRAIEHAGNPSPRTWAWSALIGFAAGAATCVGAAWLRKGKGHGVDDIARPTVRHVHCPDRL